MTTFPIAGTTPQGELVHLYPTKGDMTVRQFIGSTADRGKLTSHYTNHTRALDKFEELTGTRPKGVVAEYQKVQEYQSKPDDGHEHDWEWDDPENDDSRAIHCSICGTKGEAEPEEEEEE